VDAKNWIENRALIQQQLIGRDRTNPGNSRPNMSEQSPSKKIPRIEDKHDNDERLAELLRIAHLPTQLAEKLRVEIRSLEDAQEMLRMCLEHIEKAAATVPVDLEKHALLFSIKNALDERILRLQEEKLKQVANMQSELTISIAEKAFQVEYLDHEDTTNFIKHLEQQRENFMAIQGKKSVSSEDKQINGAKIAPYFPVIQSSGYGKSRLIEQIRKTHSTDYLVVYWSFGEGRPFPLNNVYLSPDFARNDRHMLENAFVRAIKKSLLDLDLTARTETSPLSTHTHTVALDTEDLVLDDHDFKFQKKVIFVIDEASDLLKKYTNDNVSYFRSLRRAMRMFKHQTKHLLFVVMATYSSISQLSPETSADPSNKYHPINMEKTNEPLDPFLLMATYSVHNDCSTIMSQSVEECLTPPSLFFMGRPLWHAYSGPGKLKDMSLVDFALEKLLLVNSGEDPPGPLNLKPLQRLALLASRLCLSISPTTLYASSLVAGHMARADAVSRDRLALTVSYPSEPVLAIASRDYTRAHLEAGVTAVLLTTVTELLANGAVSKGHRGEVVARFLLLWAMDQQMNCYFRVREVELVEFLNAFSRDGQVVPTKEWSTNKTNDLFKELMSATVCFTHFVYLSKNPTVPITQDLLRYAYRRTAALAVDEGRKGIDLIIPLRLGETNDFIGLVIQVKNVKEDRMNTFRKESNDITHEKLNPTFFLEKHELTTFPKKWRDVQWPSILLAVGSDESSSAEAITPNDLRDKTIVPCMILMGLNYEFLSEADVEALKLFRDFHLEIPHRGKRSTPLTYDDCLP